MGTMLENNNKGFWKKALKSNLEGFFWAEFSPGTTRRRKARQAVIAATLRIGFLTIATSFKGLLSQGSDRRKSSTNFSGLEEIFCHSSKAVSNLFKKDGKVKKYFL
jgi:hypothetical protein